MNKVILVGRLASDPEPFTTQSGISRSTFRIAVQRRFANAQGVREADFFTVIAWRQTADFCNRYLNKGRLVAVDGSIQNRSYDAQDGSKRYVTEIMADAVEFVGGRNEDGGAPRGYDNGPSEPPQYGGQAPAPQYGGQAPAPQAPASNGFTEVEDDELPF